MKGNEKAPKPWYKKWWIWLIAIMVIGGLGNMLDGEDTAAPAPVNQEVGTPNDELGGIPAETADATPKPAEETTAVEEPAAEEPAAEEPVAEPAAATDWQTEIDKIVGSGGSANEKSDAAVTLARSYTPEENEKQEFEEYIVAEYKSGNYLSGLSDENYALTNIFKSSVVDRQYEESAQVPIDAFAFDFHQNTKDVFRGISDSVESNEEQMEKALAKMN